MAGTYLDAQGIITSGPIVTATDHQTKLESFLVRNIDPPALSANYRMIKVGTRTETADGSTTWDTTPVADGPSKHLAIYDTDVDIAVALCFYGASEPSVEFRQDSMLWFDTTLHMWRVWRSSGSDPLVLDVDTTGGGWHPVQSGFELWQNKSGATANQGAPVVQDITVVHGFTTPAMDTGLKHHGVVGVVVSDVGIVDGDWGVLAMACGQAGALVAINVDNGTIDIGDVLVCSDTAGEGMTAGPLVTAAYNALGPRSFGTQYGGFAVAQEAVVVDGLVKARMLGYVGDGLVVMRVQTPLAFATSQVGAGTSAWVENDVTVALANAKHGPLLEATLDVTLTVAGGANDPVAATAQVSSRQAAADASAIWHGRTNAVDAQFFAEMVVALVNDTAAPTKLGTKFAMRTVLTTGASAAQTAKLRRYIC